ncbi:calcium-translocating P-type ATPase, PMCA-type [Leyella lascolaii]|uniref:calcium-translocating P-type ATPase, PMCA-type n=1 Tax=Leyella lascolaii TaxID=1776379 RepID=UPI002941CE6E|nr:calcium-translocating P-type ATPase, PMCA-type [Leyella lascolaii]
MDKEKEKNLSYGLNDQQVEQSRREHGENLLTPPKRTSLLRLYLEKYNDPIIRILLVAAVASLALAFFHKDFIETIGIVLAIILATTIGFYFERDAAKKFDVLTALGEESPVKVRRNGTVTEIPRKDVVVGDVVIIEVGDEIPADGRLIASTDLQIDESSLTGEPIISKHVVTDDTPSDKEATYPSDTVLRSTMVMNGNGVAVVTAVGDSTEIGKVARKATEMTAVKTPLNIQLGKLAKLISKIGTGVSVSAFVIFLTHDIMTNPLWQGTDYLKMAEVTLNYFMMAVTLIVMAVPEGLPMAVTLALALNMRRMLKSNNLVRKLHACETMGAATVICTDKTGTLTQNRMQVADMVVTAHEELMASAIALNTTANIDNEGKGIGNPTEVALLLRLRDKGTDYAEMRRTAEIKDRLPFSTERKYMATVAQVDGKDWLFVKGAPEIVMGFCNITDDEKARITAKLRAYQNKAMRTLAFACRQTDAMNVEGLTLQAVAAISDPLRTDVPDAVGECHSAGIQVKIVTGDTSATAVEIARQIGIWKDDTPATDQITGPDFAALSDEEAYRRVESLKVMSRARPTDKQRLVQLLQKHGEVVAVTGDGTNDAPALNHAHVGLSLGSGTSVAKNASDITLIDDSFQSIVKAVMWGRSLYRNIQRFIFFQLIVNVTALLLVLGGSIIGTELPLTVTQILWVNLIMDTFAAMALASLPPSHEVMKDKPRNQNDFIINSKMAYGILTMGVLFFLVMLGMLIYCERCCSVSGAISVKALTIFFTAFVMIQWWNLFNAKTLGTNHSAFNELLKDPGLLLTLCIILAGQWLIVTFGGKMFRTEPLSAEEWLCIIAGTSVVLWIGEIIRGVKRLTAKRIR